MALLKRKTTKLLDRIKSLESYLGVYYEEDWGEHEDQRRSEIERLKERVEKLEGKNASRVLDGSNVLQLQGG